VHLLHLGKILTNSVVAAVTKSHLCFLGSVDQAASQTSSNVCALCCTVHVQSVFITYMWGVCCYVAAESYASTDFIFTVMLLFMMIMMMMMATNLKYLCIFCEIVRNSTVTQNCTKQHSNTKLYKTAQ
jgi:hypothetical protein